MFFLLNSGFRNENLKLVTHIWKMMLQSRSVGKIDVIFIEKELVMNRSHEYNSMIVVLILKISC